MPPCAAHFKRDGMEIIENHLIDLDEVVIAIEPPVTQRSVNKLFAEGFDTADPNSAEALLDKLF